MEPMLESETSVVAAESDNNLKMASVVEVARIPHRAQLGLLFGMHVGWENYVHSSSFIG